MKRSVRIYVTAIVAMNIIAAIAVAFFATRPRNDDWTAAAFFALLGLVAMMLSYQRGGSAANGSVSFLPFLSAIVVSPTVAAPASIFAASLAAHAIRKQPPVRVLFNSSQFGIAASLAALIMSVPGELTYEGGFTTAHAVYLGIGALVFIGVNTLLVVGVISLAERKQFWPTWSKIISATLMYDVIAVPVIALLALCYTRYGPWWLSLVVGLIFVLRHAYKKNADLENLYEDLLKVMVASIETHDPYTEGHSRRVATYSTIIAKIARVPARTVDRIGAAALLHDVGKAHSIYVPILQKPGKLTAEERATLETHPIRSADFVDKVRSLRDLVPAVRAHHERWDGLGYPDRLVGERIPLGARVIALADTIDAMMSSRPYRPALQIADVKREVERGRGTQFDPRLVDALLTDVAWRRLEKTIRRFQAMKPGDPFPWDGSDPREYTGDMPIVAAR